jgi:glycosyltransferase involved in cell wall biosynthesis
MQKPWYINLYHFIRYVIEIFLIPILFLIAVLSRLIKKSIDVGLGPEPFISYIYHKKAFELYGYTAQTFVSDVFFITEKFDVRGDKIFFSNNPLLKKPLKYLSNICLLVLSLLRYKCIYIFFTGGPLGLMASGRFASFLWRIEPFLYKLANVKVVVMPYGGDVQDMSRSPNLLFKNAMARDYPEHRFRRRRIASKIDLWTRYANHVIGGCDWVFYLYHWDTLMLAHFSIDVDIWKPADKDSDRFHHTGNTKLRILHAPNHRTIKGTQYFIDAVNELIEDGLNIELVLLEGVPNDEIKRVMTSVDVVADQLIVGWYAMFALEAMAMGKPVLCFLDDDLKELYTVTGFVAADEIPIINCSPLTVKEVIRDLALNRDKLFEIGKQSREYVMKHHSTQAVGKVFDKINRSIGLRPSSRPS